MRRFLMVHFYAAAAGMGILNIDRALERATLRRHAGRMTALLSVGAKFGERNGPSMFEDAAGRGDTRVLEIMLGAGMDVHANQDAGLRRAAEEGHEAAVLLLLDHGASIHAREDEALWLAAAKGHLAVVQTLLRAGADPHARNDAALRLSHTFGHTAVTQELLRLGANAALLGPGSYCGLGL